MKIQLEKNVNLPQISLIKKNIKDLGLNYKEVSAQEILVISNTNQISEKKLSQLPGVKSITKLTKPFKLVSREWNKLNTEIPVKGIVFGGKDIPIIAGPCSVETPEQIQASAKGVYDAGASCLRGGAYKPRTSPYSFQGHGKKGLEILCDAGDIYDLPVVTELMDVRDIDDFLEHKVDVIQIGTRNMQNFPLLKEVGKLDIPVVLKRGLSATNKEWLMAAEYIASEGNLNIILCERGIRTYENGYRNTLDVSAIPFLKRETHLPVIVDPSHAGGASWMVPVLSLAAIAAGADGLLIESHPTPETAWSDGEQALTPMQSRFYFYSATH